MVKKFIVRTYCSRMMKESIMSERRFCILWMMAGVGVPRYVYRRWYR